MVLNPKMMKARTTVSNKQRKELQRQRLMGNKVYQAMDGLTRYLDRYHLDALIGVIPGWGDAYDDFANGVFDPETNTISYCVTYAGMDFNVILNLN